jgi:hypothetical protein
MYLLLLKHNLPRLNFGPAAGQLILYSRTLAIMKIANLPGYDFEIVALTAFPALVMGGIAIARHSHIFVVQYTLGDSEFESARLGLPCTCT